MRIIDLFSGVGGLTFGFYYRKYKDHFVRNRKNQFVFANEYNPFAAKAYSENYPDIPMKNCDIKSLKESDIRKWIGSEPVDLIIGGPPCQSFSTVGQRNYDEKAQLYTEYLRVLKIARPKMFLFENVRGILSMREIFYKRDAAGNILYELKDVEGRESLTPRKKPVIDHYGKSVMEILNDQFSNLGNGLGYNIWTERLNAIVFYSSDKENMESSLKNSDQLNGVFLADRANLLEIIGRVVQKNLKREYRISNIRGLIMDSTSEFDYICQSTTIALFEKLSSEQQDVIVRKAKEYVESAASKSGQNFEGLNKKVGKSFIKNAIQSVEYVMDNKDRYALMGLIVKFFDDGPIAQEDFSQKYSDELIKPRNKLAHAKLVYGKCHQKLHPIKNRSIPSCDGKCDSCSNEYDMEKCESLRAAIYNYYKVFQNIEKKTNELVPLE